MKTKTNIKISGYKRKHNETQALNRVRGLIVKTGVKAGPGSKGGSGEWISNHNETQVHHHVRGLTVKTGVKAGPFIRRGCCGDGGDGDWIGNHNETQVHDAM